LVGDEVESKQREGVELMYLITKPVTTSKEIVTTSKEIVINKIRKPSTTSYSGSSKFSDIYSSQLQIDQMWQRLFE
jgi:hypothetical protein